jgi:hypothetical protein
VAWELLELEAKDVEEVKEVKDKNYFPFTVPRAALKNPGA